MRCEPRASVHPDPRGERSSSASSSALAASFAYVNPVIAVALGVGLAGDTIGVAGIVAMGIILLAVVLVMVAKE